MYFLTNIINMLMIQRNQHFPFTERLNNNFNVRSVCGFIQQKGVWKGEYPPPPPRFQPNVFQYAATSQLQDFGAPEATRSNISWWSISPDPPTPHVHLTIDSFPSLTKNPVYKTI